jgi:predicted alpha/beta superfamily hydrolase
MKCWLWIGMIIAAVLAGCGNQPLEKTEHFTTTFRHYSEFVKDTFYISIQVPLEYNLQRERRYPTVVLLDGNFYFPMMSSVMHQYETARLLPPMILVGIGYNSFNTMDSLRSRDYLFPESLASDELTTLGGGENFEKYIVEELLPKIDEEFRTRGEDRSLLGHSLGGYFSLYTLLNQVEGKSRTFRNFVSASPTLWYHDYYLNRLVEALKKRREKNVLTIFLSAGELEDSTWTVGPVKKLNHDLVERNIDAVDLQIHVYNQLDHMDVGMLSFTKGLQQFYRRRGRPSRRP